MFLLSLPYSCKPSLLLVLFVYSNVGLYLSGLICVETEQDVPGEKVALPAGHRCYADAQLIQHRAPVTPPRGISPRCNDVVILLQAVDNVNVQPHSQLPSFVVVVGKYPFQSQPH